MRKLTFFNQALVADGDLYGVQIFPVNILYQCHFQHLLIIGYPDITRHLTYTRNFGSTQAAFAGY